MKKFITTFILLAFVLVTTAYAEDKTLTFAWDEPADLESITEWKIYITETAGGPYNEIAVVPNGGTFQAPATFDITGAPETTERRYFVMIACGDLPSGYKCSDNSNEIFYDFVIPKDSFSVPLNFRILPEG